MLAGHALLLPVELHSVNQSCEHQQFNILCPSLSPTLRTKGQWAERPTMSLRLLMPLHAMAHNDLIDQIAERVEHLLVRHEELQRTNTLLTQQVQALTQERDQLKSRLSAARSRVDALIDRLPNASSSESST